MENINKIEMINYDESKTNQSSESEDEYFNTIRRHKKIDSQSQKSLSIPFRTENKFCKKDFQILGLLGRGKRGKVVKAMLIILTLYKKNKLYQIYLENELLLDLSHPNIIKIYGIFEENDKIYIVLEYCEKGEFNELLKNNTPLPYKTAQYFTAQIINTLEYLQDKGIAHRNLKPDNIMLDERWNIKIINFYCAKNINKEFDKIRMNFVNKKNLSILKKNTFVGTPEYISPELLNDEEVSCVADLWALGCIIYEMYTRQSPFKDNNTHFTFKKIQEKKSVIIPKEIPMDVSHLIQSLLVHDPNERLGSGQKGSDNDFSSLKKHYFFIGIDFNELNSMDLPNLNELHIKLFFKENTINKTQESIINDCIFPTKGEPNIVKQGIVKKKSPWFHYNSRKLTLFGVPKKLEYYDLTRNISRGVIYLTDECQAQLVNSNRFELNTTSRKFIFKTEENDASDWTILINNVIKS